jgi:hypothetical protein
MKRRRERAEKANRSVEAMTVAPEPSVTQAVSDPIPVPPAVVPPLATGASNSTQATFDPPAGAGRTRKWPWILLSIVSGLVLGPIVALSMCALGKFCTGNFLPYILVSMAVCAVGIWFLIRIALLPAHGTASKRATRIGLRIVVSALIGPSLGIIIAFVIALTTSQRDFPTPWFVYSSVACTILLWLGLNRRGPLRARTGPTVVTS